MLWYHIVILALIQGLTEFLPISSSAHLILPSQLLGWPDQGLAFDVAVHVGTLVAVVSYFWKDLWKIAQGWLSGIVHRRVDQTSKLGWCIILGTIPAGLCGVLFENFIETHFRTIEVIAYTTIGFGVLLWVSDKFAPTQKGEAQLGYLSGFLIGCAQAIALIPGTSRSGVTMTAARAMGFDRQTAARFSFLLSVPLITAAGGLKLIELIGSNIAVDWNALVWGVLISAISAYLCIYFFLKWLNSMGFLPFLFYRLVLGAILLVIVYSGS
ncbi:undecaprenyl-diphosphate phosphatase [Marinomonas mediterranea]|uniref:Undecaprenyl-diphosphatase n=1 Tax=Marinomonas mediterranea (strain ATCC 700492 / JCM 21426 / NBRC 103028 / MMB-1) TaxID=717774 RepID=F2JTY1_MARM1|nr:undecaprenyl-diphosphate phosphatase [Marinomonas mediterranea]ADZ90402.1 Undecaprenyl-diphosphatase [Marinomonas mediterranea MMB-1]WCN08457.1 undecaprenyl-diphosphate phosphatase [Marinomonas mediterranea]WCN12511.1 undecaprenyl-diphosphate phosphatase [Marinomonas mediterranea]WCN16583.1 undecaprenyl-diphosphate phosphatase [Marinomonas mediterranea MMB-1]